MTTKICAAVLVVSLDFITWVLYIVVGIVSAVPSGGFHYILGG
jgi:hypothetical protein